MIYMPTADTIIQAVCKVFNVTPTELTTRRKGRRLTDARIVAAYFLRVSGNKCHSDINRLLNQRAGSWASWAVWRCHDLADVNKDYAAKCVAVYEQLKKAT